MKTYEYERPQLTVDTVIFTLIDHRLNTLLVQRDKTPEEGVWTLPGGFVHTEVDEDADETARRVLLDKAGVTASHLEQLYTFTGRTRDKRGWSASVTYMGLVRDDDLRPVSERARWELVDSIQALPFDHMEMLARALRRVRDKSSYSSLPAFLLPRTFTFPQLQRVYEEVLSTTLNPAAFRRKILDQHIIELAEEDEAQPQHKGAGRPAAHYRLSKDVLHDMGRVVMLPDVRRGG